MDPTVIRFRTREMPMSALGPPGRLPLFRAQQPMRGAPVPPHVGLGPEERTHPFTFGDESILPYRVQDDYDRSQKPGRMPLVEIRNGRLCAAVAPQLGGRLMSLRDLRLDRELLFCNPVFQPANLAALNAWFSGGIEWNGPTPGHSPFTCSPVFCGVVSTERGDVLRLHEFDRIAECTWQIDLFLPPDDDRLFVHGRLVNPDASDKLVYWWTNVAVACTPGLRVLSPADYSVEHVLPGNQLERLPFPHPDKPDGSYPGNWRDATSVFFRKPGAQRLWIAALDEAGDGLMQVGSAALQGRKFFYFGTAPGGRRWMDHLARPGEGDYIELQSGLAPTQNQRVVLPASGEIHWTEGFAAARVDRALAHDRDYPRAVGAAAQAVEARFPAPGFDDIDRFLRTVSRLPVTRPLWDGSPWGARQERLTGRPLAEGLAFARAPAATPAEPADAWDELLETGRFGAASLERVPSDVVVSPRWCALLERSARQHGETWLHALMLGIAAFDRDATEEAAAWFTRSLELRPTWLGWRQRALVSATPQERRHAYRQAWAMPDAPPALAVELLDDLVGAGLHEEASAFAASLPPRTQSLERLRLARARLAMECGDWDTLEALLQDEFATVREGERLLDTLWLALQRARWQQHGERAAAEGTPPVSWLAWQHRHPVPAHLEYRLVIPEPQAQPDGKP